uniref:Uncharacterized protein n=1 Tax=viral metagenome TaxID=1070528 RepID=A0A6M3XPH8_9ZZZZ
MATLKAANVTKYDAGGSGDNIVADGLIKTVEKVWIDTYAVAAAIPTTSSLMIARIPKGKKLTDVIVYLPVLSAAATTSTVYLETAASTTVSAWGGALEALGTGSYAVATATIGTVRLGQTKVFSEFAADTALYLMINPATTITAGTIKTIVKWT